MNEIEENNKQ